MTNKEAIEQLKELKLHCEDFRDGEDSVWAKDVEALNSAIEALEKQIPKKVKYKNRHGQGYDIYNKDYYNCPSCGRRLRNKQKDNYCGRCGQAIDWSEEERHTIGLYLKKGNSYGKA